MFYLKRFYFCFLESFDLLLDSISSRTCFFCKIGLGALICDACLEKELSLKKKSVDYKALEHFFYNQEQVHHPKIFYLFNFFASTSFLIKKAKYTRPYFAKFFASLLSTIFLKKINSIFNDELAEGYLNDFPIAKKKLNLYISYTPMHSLKEKDRAFNFAKLVASSFNEKLNGRIKKETEVLFQSKQGLKKYSVGEIHFLESYFVRKKNTRALFNLGQDSRIKEVQNSFELDSKLDIIKNEDLNVLLIIDDICTTGSTFMELMKLSRIEGFFDDQIAFSIYGRNLN